MRKGLLFTISILFGSMVFGQTPNVLYTKTLGSTGAEGANDVCIDADGNIIVVGSFNGTLDLDPGPGVLNVVSDGSIDFFVSKYDASGNLLWAYGFGDYNTDGVNAVVTDQFNNIYVTGRFNETVDFDPGAGVFELTSSGGSDPFVLSLDADGDFIYAKQFDCSGGTSQAMDLVVDNGLNVYLTGSFAGSGNFDTDGGTYTLTALPGPLSSIFIAKLDNSGSLVWAVVVGGDSGNNFGYDIDLDDDGNVYTAGVFGGNIDMDPGAGTDSKATFGYDDNFIIKLNNDGLYQWGYNFGGAYGDNCFAMTVDDLNRPIIAGDFRFTVDFDPGPGTFNLTNVGSTPDIYILRLLADGTFDWAGSIGGMAGANGTRCYAIKTDADNDIYLTGFFDELVDFDPSSGVLEKTPMGSNDGYVAKINEDGTGAWVKTFGSDVYEEGGKGIAVDPLGNVFVVGAFVDTCDFDGGTGVIEIISKGSSDVFFMKIGECDLDLAVTVSGTTLTASASGVSYQWVDCNDSFASVLGATSKTFVPMVDGDYAVVISTGTCADTSACNTISGVSVEEFENKTLTVYPNPANSTLNISAHTAIFQVTLFDLQGKEIMRTNVSSFDISPLPNGIYFMNILTADGVAHAKFVKE